MPLFYKEIRWKKPLLPVPAESPVPADYPDRLKAHWNDDKLLREDVLAAMKGGYSSAAYQAAIRLIGIDPQPERSFLLQSTLLVSMGDLDQAELVLMQFITQHGLTATILAHLGNVQLARGHWPYAADLLWQALEFDPNHPEALMWWESVRTTMHGPDQVAEALMKVATLPGSWRPKARLAARASQSGAREEALEWWQKSLVDAPPGEAGWRLVAEELATVHSGVDLLLGHFDPARHGIAGGLLLLQWLRVQGRVEEARNLLSRIAPFDTPETRREIARQALELARLQHSVA